MPRPKKSDSAKPANPKTTRTKAKTTKPVSKSTAEPKEKSLKEKEQFPHIGFPYRLEYMEDKDKKICFFQCENHMEKHITRHKLNRKTCKISVKED